MGEEIRSGRKIRETTMPVPQLAGLLSGWLARSDPDPSDSFYVNLLVEETSYPTWFLDEGCGYVQMLLNFPTVMPLSKNGAEALIEDLRPKLRKGMQLFFLEQSARFSATIFLPPEAVEDEVDGVFDSCMLLAELFEEIARTSMWGSHLLTLALSPQPETQIFS